MAAVEHEEHFLSDLKSALQDTKEEFEGYQTAEALLVLDRLDDLFALITARQNTLYNQEVQDVPEPDYTPFYFINGEIEV